MKKVLVTGAGGMIGFQVISYLVNDKNYEVTALDLKSPSTIKKLSVYKDCINIIYGDINDEVLIDSLVKTHDYVIHLAAVIPPLADQNTTLTELVNYGGTKNIVDAINKSNPSCFLFYSSSISVYGDRINNPMIKITDKLNPGEYDFYAKTKIKTEKYIIKHLKNYTIFRLTGIMGRPGIDPLMFHMPLDTKLEICSDFDTAYAFFKALEHTKELKGKIFNLAGGKKCRTTYREFIARMFKIYGINIKFIKTMIFAEKNFHCGYYEDGDVLENILHFRRDTLESYYSRVDKETNKTKRFFSRLLSRPIVYFLNKKSEPKKALDKNDEELKKRFFNK